MLLRRHERRRAPLETTILLALVVVIGAADASATAPLRFADVVHVAGTELAPFTGYPVGRLTLLSCVRSAAATNACQPIPAQLDEVDAEGRWVLDQGPQPNADEPPGILDANDQLFFMAADAGDRVQRADLPGRGAAAEIAIDDPLMGSRQWAYLVAVDEIVPRLGRSYVRYDPSADRVHGQRVSLGFRHGVPGYLALNADGAAPGAAVGADLLDRFKVRGTATFLWGLIRFSRSEDDVSTEFVAWRQGPIRIIRRQKQWVRIGWGIRSPTFGSYTYFYRDSAELPVGLRLNFPPTYFFGDITIRAVLDFRDLRGWALLVPDLPEPLPIDGRMTADKAAVNHMAGSWFALRGPDITFVQVLEVGPSLSSVRRRLIYGENDAHPDPPEEVPGQNPAVGYQLDRWEHVGAGAHQLASTSYALPADVDVRQFMAARRVPLRVAVQAMPPPERSKPKAESRR